MDTVEYGHRQADPKSLWLRDGKASKSSTDAAAKPDDILRFTSISNFEPKDS